MVYIHNMCTDEYMCVANLHNFESVDYEDVDVMTFSYGSMQDGYDRECILGDILHITRTILGENFWTQTILVTVYFSAIVQLLRIVDVI